jgi:predicted nuclease of predicted toxin-antitoxin system
VKILLDEMLPRTLAQHLSGAETVRDRGWSGLKNSALLQEAEAAGFSILLTADRSLGHQQNIAALGIGVLVLPTSKLDVLLGRVAEIEKALPTIRPGMVVELS